jgi:hypothetical protein
MVASTLELKHSSCLSHQTHQFSVSGFRFPVSGFRFPVSGFRFPVSGFRFPVSGFRFPVSSFRFRFPVSGFQFSKVQWSERGIGVCTWAMAVPAERRSRAGRHEPAV